MTVKGREQTCVEIRFLQSQHYIVMARFATCQGRSFRDQPSEICPPLNPSAQTAPNSSSDRSSSGQSGTHATILSSIRLPDIKRRSAKLKTHWPFSSCSAGIHPACAASRSAWYPGLLYPVSINAHGRVVNGFSCAMISSPPVLAGS